MRRAAPCSSAEKIQPKGQVSVKRCWCLGAAARCPSGRAVQGCDRHSALLGPFPSPAQSSLELLPGHKSHIPCPDCPQTGGKLVLTFFPPGEDVSGGGVLVMFRGLEPQLEGDEPLILKTCMKQGMDLQATQRLGVLNADFSTRYHKVLKA